MARYCDVVMIMWLNLTIIVLGRTFNFLTIATFLADIWPESCEGLVTGSLLIHLISMVITGLTPDSQISPQMTWGRLKVDYHRSLNVSFSRQLIMLKMMSWIHLLLSSEDFSRFLRM